MSPVTDTPSIHLGKVLRERGEARTEGEFSRLAYHQGDQIQVLETRGPAYFEVEVHTVDDDDFWLQGRIEATVLQDCARCLRPTEVPLELTLGTMLRYNPKIETPYLDEDESGQDIWVFNEATLELAPYFSEMILMGMPLSTLHDPHCKGLCSVCGQDLNEGPCPHHPAGEAAPVGTAPAPRANPFAVLSGLELPDE